MAVLVRSFLEHLSLNFREAVRRFWAKTSPTLPTHPAFFEVTVSNPSDWDMASSKLLPMYFMAFEGLLHGCSTRFGAGGLVLSNHDRDGAAAWAPDAAKLEAATQTPDAVLRIQERQPLGCLMFLSLRVFEVSGFAASFARYSRDSHFGRQVFWRQSIWVPDIFEAAALASDVYESAALGARCFRGSRLRGRQIDVSKAPEALLDFHKAQKFSEPQRQNDL